MEYYSMHTPEPSEHPVVGGLRGIAERHKYEIDFDRGKGDKTSIADFD